VRQVGLLDAQQLNTCTLALSGDLLCSASHCRRAGRLRLIGTQRVFLIAREEPFALIAVLRARCNTRGARGVEDVAGGAH